MARSKQPGAANQGAGSARTPSDEELRWITQRAVDEIIPRDEFIAMLKSGRTLRLKMGFDPTRPVITLGWAVGLRKLRRLQELGHTVVVIIGDWTARIGDPSGQSRTRNMRTTRQVRADANAILEKFFKILDPTLTEVKWQREWFDKFPLTKLARLAGHVTVSKMLERDDFEKRYNAEKPIHLQEFIYPLLQAYDSVAVRADVEFGGTDQKFNILLGRDIQPKYKQQPQSAFLVPLLAGYRGGGEKMSQSLDNYIAIDEPPQEMYGKLMSVPDRFVNQYFELLTNVPDTELESIRKALHKGGVGARDEKMRLARDIVSQFYGVPAAEEAEREFQRVFGRREAPDQTRIYRLSFRTAAEKFQRHVADVDGVRRVDSLHLPKVLVEVGLAPSQSHARRLIKSGAVDINGDVHTSEDFALIDGLVFRVGKHRFLRIVDSDQHGPGEA